MTLLERISNGFKNCSIITNDGYERRYRTVLVEDDYGLDQKWIRTMLVHPDNRVEYGPDAKYDQGVRMIATRILNANTIIIDGHKYTVDIHEVDE